MKLALAFFTCLLCTCCVCLRARAQVAVAVEKLLYSTNGTSHTAPDSAGLFVLREIQLEGNRQTKAGTILRELPFRVNDQLSYKKLTELLAETQKRLMNTGLFLNVVVSLTSVHGYDAFVKIEVRERWYLYPIPFIRTVDNSIGKWISEQDMDPGRVNYGVKLTHKNTTGRNDRLQLNLINGYTKGIGLAYRGLFLDKQLRWSASLGVSMGRNKELTYQTEGNKQLAYKSNEHFVHSYLNSFAEVSYRKAIKTRHTFGLRYQQDRVADTILNINPAYSFNKQNIRFTELYYNFSYFDVDFIPYPTSGYMLNATVVKRGFAHANLFQLQTKASGSWPLGRKFYSNLRVGGMLRLPFKQPYMNQSFLGGGDMYLQGYEYFAIDGVAGGYSKLSFSRELINTQVGIPSARFKRLNKIPFRAYAKIYGNAGYVHNPQAGNNPLCNQMMYSGGVGIDIITFYDFIIKLEWSFNQLGQNRLYLHRKDYY